MQKEGKIRIGIIAIVAIALFVAMISLVGWNNYKYKKINENVTTSVEKYLEEYLGTRLQANVEAGTLEKEQKNSGIAQDMIAEISKEDREEIIESVIGAITPSLQTKLESNNQTVRNETLKEMEKTIEEKVREILSTSDTLTEEQKEILIEKITVSVETKIMQTIKENYAELTKSIETLETYIDNNLKDIERKLNEYQTKMQNMENTIAELKSSINKLNVQTGSDNSSISNRLDTLTNNYNTLQKSFSQYVLEMDKLLASLGLDGEDTNLVEMITSLRTSLQAADEELNQKLDTLAGDLKKQLENNQAKLKNLDTVQAQLESYIKAVESGDETERGKLKESLEGMLGDLDDSTRKSIQDVLSSAATDKEELQSLIDAANGNIEKSKEDLNNSITNLSDELAGLNERISTVADNLQKQLDNNKEKMDNLNAVQGQLDQYIKAVEAGDENERNKLKQSLEGMMDSLDESTRQSIEDVLGSAATDKQELQGLIDAANANIEKSKDDLRNSITELSEKIDSNTKRIDKELADNAARISQLDQISNTLDQYIKAVETGDEAARNELKSQIEASLTDLDDATKESIQKVLDSASSDKEELKGLVDAANVNLDKAKSELSNSITENSKRITELDKKVDNNAKQMSGQLSDNTEKIKNLDQISTALDEYIRAVESGDESAREQLKKQIESSMTDLDDATKKSIQDVLDSASKDKQDMQKLIDQANEQLSKSKEELSNKITDISNELSDMKNSIMTGRFVQETDGSTSVIITIPAN